jgi:hypothetical protein
MTVAVYVPVGDMRYLPLPINVDVPYDVMLSKVQEDFPKNKNESDLDWFARHTKKLGFYNGYYGLRKNKKMTKGDWNSLRRYIHIKYPTFIYDYMKKICGIIAIQKIWRGIRVRMELANPNNEICKRRLLRSFELCNQ